MDESDDDDDDDDDGADGAADDADADGGDDDDDYGDDDDDEQELQAAGPDLVIWASSSCLSTRLFRKENMSPGPEQVAQEEWQPMQEGEPDTLVGIEPLKGEDERRKKVAKPPRVG